MAQDGRHGRRRRHSIAKVLVGAALIIAVAWAALAAVSHIVWNRSAMATVAELYLSATGSKRIFSGGQATVDHLAERAAVEDEPYQLPKTQHFSVSVDEFEFEGMQVFRLNADSEASTGKVVFFIHGGAYVNEIIAPHWSFLDALAARSGAQIVVPLYRLAPNHSYNEVWPSMLELYASVVDEFGAKNITLMGDSAGGGFAAALAEYLAQQGEPQPAHLVLLSPWVDISCSNPEITSYENVDPMLSASGLVDMARAWAGEAWTDNPKQMDWRLSPLYGDVSDLHDVHVYVGTREILYPDVVAFVHKVQDEGVACELVIGQGLNHDWPLYPIPEALAVQADIAEIVAS